MRLTLTIVASIAMIGCAPADTVQPPASPVTTVAPTTSTTTTTTTTTVAPTTTVVTFPEGFYLPTLKPNVPCQEWAQTAHAAGWPLDLLPELLWEVWSESRCQNIIDGHKNFNGWDRGPLQINKVWLNEIEDKYGSWEYVKDPYYNFAWGWEMYKWYDYHRGCGFIPWSRPCK